MSLLWSISIAISSAIAFLCYFYERDRCHGKSYGAKINVFLLGISSIVPTAILETLGDYRFDSGQLSIDLQQYYTLKKKSVLPIVDALFSANNALQINPIPLKFGKINVEHYGHCIGKPLSEL